MMVIKLLNFQSLDGLTVCLIIVFTPYISREENTNN